MSEYLDLNDLINGYQAIVQLRNAWNTGVDTGNWSGFIDTVDAVNNFLKPNSVAEEVWAPSVFNRDGTSGDSEGDYTGNKATFYPSNLFDNGNVPYILFYMKPSEQVTEGVDKFGGSGQTPHARIGLYMPPAVKVNYGAKWEESTLNVKLFRGIIDNTIQNGGVESGVLARGGWKVADAAFQTGNSFAENDAFNKKTIVDPKNALLFKGVNFRRFQFDFQMMARNTGEAEAIRKIIKTFKYGMHPGYAADTDEGAMWSYPHFFEIYLCTPVRKYMFNIMNAALEEMDVDYGGSGVASFFREDGAPVDIRLSLQFKELFVLTKELIMKDY